MKRKKYIRWLRNEGEYRKLTKSFTEALQVASRNGHEEIVHLLLPYEGEYPNQDDGYLLIDLRFACEDNNKATVKLLLEYGVDDLEMALKAAASHGHERIVQMFVQYGINVSNKCGHEALRSVISGGHDDVVILLIKSGLDVNDSRRNCGSALEDAAYHQDSKIVQILLDHGADANSLDERRNATPLQIASSRGQVNIVQVLLEHGANINAPGKENGNALRAASIHGHEMAVCLLLKKGAEVNSQGGKPGNALQDASYEGHEEIVRLLLDNGADINAQGGPHGSAIQAASRRGHEKIVQILLEHGAVSQEEPTARTTGTKRASSPGPSESTRTLRPTKRARTEKSA